MPTTPATMRPRREARKTPCVTVSHLVVLVAVVAVNLAVARSLPADEMRLYGVGPMGLALQVAAFRLLRNRGRSRAFWAGFLVSGAAALASFVWGLARPGQGSGELWAFDRLAHEWTWASRMFGFWAGCGKLAAEVLPPLPKRAGIPRFPGYVWWYDDPNHRLWAESTAAGGLFGTQLAIALAGGLLARQVAKRRHNAPGIGTR